jgi:hypothetical protein
MKSKDQILLEAEVQKITQGYIRNPNSKKQIIQDPNSLNNYNTQVVPKVLDTLKEFGVEYDSYQARFSFTGKLENVVSFEVWQWKNKSKGITFYNKNNNAADSVNVYFENTNDFIQFLRNILSFL